MNLSHLTKPPFGLSPQQILDRVVVVRHGLGASDEATILVLDEPVAPGGDRAAAACAALERHGVRAAAARGAAHGSRIRALLAASVDFPAALATLHVHKAPHVGGRYCP